jgi:hypothetical protein
VDEYEASPDSWMHGSGKAGSYFVPILPEHGMWLDFNANNSHSHHVAAVVSVQGVNPLTGLKADPLRLEQYRETCPKHKVMFQMNRHCPECKYAWHPQNYISSNNGSAFWIDGFRTEDGVVRQWYFTEEECKGVAAQILGKDRVFAIGVAFYLSKNPKPKPAYQVYCASAGSPYSWGAGGTYGSSVVCSTSNPFVSNSYCKSLGDAYANQKLGSFEAESAEPMKSAVNITKGIDPDFRPGRIIRKSLSSTRAVPAKQLEIGAGAKIIQQINPDPENLDFWQDEPAGLLYINYCDVVTARTIIARGKRAVAQDGFLNGLQLKDK